MANVSEAVKAGKGLLIDEDDSAINFLLPSVFGRNIRPFRDSIPKSTVVMVSSALKDFIDMADRVVVMENYVAKKVYDGSGTGKIDYGKWKCQEKVGKARIARVEKYRIEISGKYVELSGQISKTIYERAQTYLLAELLEKAMGMEGDRWEIAGKLHSMAQDFRSLRDGNYTMVTRYQIYYMLNRYPFMKGQTQQD